MSWPPARCRRVPALRRGVVAAPCCPHLTVSTVRGVPVTLGGGRRRVSRRGRKATSTSIVQGTRVGRRAISTDRARADERGRGEARRPQRGSATARLAAFLFVLIVAVGAVVLASLAGAHRSATVLDRYIEATNQQDVGAYAEGLSAADAPVGDRSRSRASPRSRPPTTSSPNRRSRAPRTTSGSWPVPIPGSGRHESLRR